MSATFGSGDISVTLRVEKGGERDSLNLILIGEPFELPDGPLIKLGFDP
ncbi:hypothetical protein ACRAQ6_03410 [Erythrobacter sp. HA6-11]